MVHDRVKRRALVFPSSKTTSERDRQADLYSQSINWYYFDMKKFRNASYEVGLISEYYHHITPTYEKDKTVKLSLCFFN